MNKQYKILFLLLILTVHKVYAQKFDEFLINEDKQAHPTSFVSQCQNPELGVIVFTSSINGIAFKIKNGDSLLKSIEHDNVNNQYILCVRPISRYQQYQISVSCYGYKDRIFTVSAIGASEVKWFLIDSKDKSLFGKLSQTNRDIKSLEQDIKYEKFQNKKLQKDNSYISAGFGSGVNMDFPGEWTVEWRSNGKIGWGLHGGYMPIKAKNNYEKEYTHYSAGLKCFPLQESDFAKELMKPVTMQDLYILVSYGTLTKYPEVTSGVAVIVGIDWVIPAFKNPSGGFIIRMAAGKAFPEIKTSSSMILEGGISLYLNL